MRSFAALPAIAAFVPFTLAAPSQYTRSDTQDVKVVIQRLKATSETDIAVTEATTSQVVGYACSNALNTGSFVDYPITADVDESGGGTLTIGSTTYKVHENPEISGGITCTRVFNDVEMYMTCTATVPSSLQLTPISKRDSTNCFQSGSPGLQMTANAMLNGAAPPPAGNITARKAEAINKRQAPCGSWTGETQIVGDGNPHQNYLLKQLSVSSQSPFKTSSFPTTNLNEVHNADIESTGKH